jgi:pyruvate dehydrogenase E1 component alpha subunit
VSAFHRAHGVQALRTMLVIRAFESRLPGFSQEGLIRGSTHSSVGMEAVPVGTSLALAPGDFITSNHRGHGHCLAKGADPGRVLAEIFGRSDGYCSGKGGSMHLAVAELGILGANGIVGAGIGLAAGAALAAQLGGTGAVAVAYFGDGASNQGVLAEAMNLTALWRLPVILVCENNHYAQSSALEEMLAQPRISRRGEAYGVESFDVDGMDVAAVHALVSERVAAARAGHGPSLVVADTYRYLGHMAGDTEIYRRPDEVEAWRGRDPVERLAAQLAALGLLDDDARQALERECLAVVDAAEAFARRSPFPDAAQATTDVLGAAA